MTHELHKRQRIDRTHYRINNAALVLVFVFVFGRFLQELPLRVIQTTMLLFPSRRETGLPLVYHGDLRCQTIRLERYFY